MAEVRDSRTIAQLKGRHSGGSAVIMASGPSLTREQCQLLKDAPHVLKLGVNRSYEWLWPDYHFVQDSYWFHQTLTVMEELDAESKLIAKDGAKCGITVKAAQKTGRTQFQWYNSWSWDVAEDGVPPCPTPGFALQVGVYLGIERFTFVGLDLHFDLAKNKTHFFGRHHLTQAESKWDNQHAHFEFASGILLEAGYRVSNSSPGTALEAFPYFELEDFLDLTLRERVS